MTLTFKPPHAGVGITNQNQQNQAPMSRNSETSLNITLKNGRCFIDGRMVKNGQSKDLSYSFYSLEDALKYLSETL